MKYLRLYEEYDNIINHFLKKFSEYIKMYKNAYLDPMNYYNIPNSLEEEFALLYYLYDQNTYNSWKSGDKQEDNSAKRKIKQYIQNLIIKKMNENPKIYDELQSVFDKRPNWGNSNKFGSISEANIKYIFFNLHSALKNAPEHLKQANKYNL